MEHPDALVWPKQLQKDEIREFTQQIGKQKFFTFGGVFDPQTEEDIARFIGRNTRDASELVGVDAAMDVPLYEVLRKVTEGFNPPSDLISMFHLRKEKARRFQLSRRCDAVFRDLPGQSGRK